MLLRKHHEAQESYVRTYHKLYSSFGGMDEVFNAAVTATLQSRLAFMSPELRLRALLSRILLIRPLRPPRYLITYLDRSKSADFTMTNIARLRTRRLEQLSESYAQPVPPKQWLEEAMELQPWVSKIQERGGQVIFVRYITTEGHWELDEKTFPKALYWDAFARLTSATTIHFADHPTLQGYFSPDTSHLDPRDTPKYTLALSQILEHKGVIVKHGSPSSTAKTTRE